MTKTPTTNVVIPHEIGSLSAIARVKSRDLPLRTEIDLNSMLLEHRLRQVIDVSKT
jgi:hypothetical protein